MPTHADNESIVNERFFFDKDNPALLHDEITLEDHAFTRPWTVLKTYAACKINSRIGPRTIAPTTTS
jgi:hypothetical protein